MKKILIALFCLIYSVASAQKKVEYGLKGGILLSKFRGEDFNGIPPTSPSLNPERVTTNLSPTFGYTVGGYVRTLEDVFLQAELLVSMKGANIDRYTPGGKTSIQANFGQIDIPFSVGYKYKKVEVLGGLSFSTTFYDDGKLKTLLNQYATIKSSPYQTLTLGYHIGAGVNLNRISINARFMGGIQQIVDATVYYPDPNLPQGSKQSSFQQRTDMWQLTVGYKLK